MGASTVSKEVAYEAALESSVAIVTPDEGAGRQMKACLDAVGGFAATVVFYEGRTPVDPGWQEPEIILVPVKDAESGLRVCRQLRLTCDLPMVICSGNAREQDIVRALESGADDYVLMPVQPRVLGARLRSLLRRSAGWSSSEPAEPILAAGQFKIVLNDQRAFQRGAPIHLSTTEFRLLASLMRRPGQLVTHAQLLAEAWGPQYVDSRNYLRLYVQYLREKIEDDSRRPRFIINERGVGYRFEPAGAGALPATPRAAA